MEVKPWDPAPSDAGQADAHPPPPRPQSCDRSPRSSRLVESVDGRHVGERVLVRDDLGLAAGGDAASEILDLEAVLVIAFDVDPHALSVDVLELEAEGFAEVDERARHEDAPRGAEHVDLGAVGLREAAQEQRRHSAAEVEHPLELLVDALRAQLLLPAYRDRRVPRQPARHVDAVGADVVERAAAELGPAADVLRILDREREDRPDAAQVPDRPGGEALAHDAPLRMEAVHERLHPDHVALGAVGDGVLRLGARTGCGLLAEHVLARVGAALRPLGVEMVRQADVDGVDLGIGEQLVVAADPHDVAQRLTLARREIGVREEPLRPGRSCCRSPSARRPRR